jgi:hypothetical protein
MTVGSPAAEAKFSVAISSAQHQNSKVVEYPVIRMVVFTFTITFEQNYLTFLASLNSRKY